MLFFLPLSQAPQTQQFWYELRVAAEQTRGMEQLWLRVAQLQLQPVLSICCGCQPWCEACSGLKPWPELEQRMLVPITIYYWSRCLTGKSSPMISAGGSHRDIGCVSRVKAAQWLAWGYESGWNNWGGGWSLLLYWIGFDTRVNNISACDSARMNKIIFISHKLQTEESPSVMALHRSFTTSFCHGA